MVSILSKAGVNHSEKVPTPQEIVSKAGETHDGHGKNSTPGQNKSNNSGAADGHACC